MGFSKNFRLVCLTFAVLMAAAALTAAEMLQRGHYVSAAGATLVLAGLVLALIRYVEHTNRSLNVLLKSLEFGDCSSRAAPGPKGATFRELRETLDGITRGFQERLQNREERLQYLFAIIQHLGVGLLVYDSGENVVLTNNATRTLLDVPAPRTLSDLEPAHPELVSRLRQLKPGDRVLASVFVEGDVSQIALRASDFRSNRQLLTLVSLQNISAELNEKELDAWQNLIRILTHEVKNSLTPIASLAGSVDKLLSESSSAISPATSEKVAEALRIIRKRSDGLLRFIDAYRDLTHLPAPHYRECVVAELFSRIETLVSARLEGGSISFGSSIDPPDLTLTADPHLVEQALINLSLNAIEAVSGRPDSRISLEAFIDSKGRPVIRVTDNGPGILAEVIEKVFIPFFTTKKSGSGIGLSLSRQIVRMHGGSLTVHSDPQKQTVFTMRF